MSSRSCPDWPELMEIAPELQFRHYTVDELHLQAALVGRMPTVPLNGLTICCDPEHHVFNPAHTEPEVVEALTGSHWFSVHEWSQRGPGAAA